MPRITRGGLVLGAMVFSSTAILLFGAHRFESLSGTPASAPAAGAPQPASPTAQSAPLAKSEKSRPMPPTGARVREQAIPAAVVLLIAVVSVAVLLARGRT